MTLRRRLLCYLGFGLGLVGVIACLAGMFGLWQASARLRQAAEAIFAAGDELLSVTLERTEDVAQRVSDAKITTESVVENLKVWGARQAGQRVAAELNLADKTEGLRSGMEQASDWLEVAGTTTRLLQQLLEAARASGLSWDSSKMDQLGGEIANLQTGLSNATEVVDRLHQHIEFLAEEPSLDERLEQANQAALRLIATFSALDTSLHSLTEKIWRAQFELDDLKAKALGWIRLVNIAAMLLFVWIAAGQSALCYLAVKGLRTPAATASG